MSTPLNEETVELAAREWLSELGYTTAFGPDIAPGEDAAERDHFDEVALMGRLQTWLPRINPGLPPTAIDEAIRKIMRTESQNPVINNHTFHRWLVDGVDVSYRTDGQVKHGKVWLVDYDDLLNGNDWFAVNQFTVTGVNFTTHARIHHARAYQLPPRCSFVREWATACRNRTQKSPRRERNHP